MFALPLSVGSIPDICPFARLPWFVPLGRRHLFPALPVPKTLSSREYSHNIHYRQYESIKRPGVFKDHHLCYQRYVVELPHSLLFVVWSVFVSVTAHPGRGGAVFFLFAGSGGISNQHLSYSHTEDKETDSGQSFDTGHNP